MPPYALDQDDVMRRVHTQFGKRSAVVERLLPALAETGIERRHSCVPIEWYYDAHGWPDRNRVYLDSAVSLLESATRDVLARNHLSESDVDAIVVVSTTGIATPSLDALLMERMSFKRTVARLPIFGLGCAGGTLGLARAAAMAQFKPGSMVLLLVIELCALSFRRDDFTKSNIVATTFFGDGAAAALLSTDGEGAQIEATGEYTFPRTLDMMGWDVADDGLKAIFSRDILQLVNDEMRDVATTFLAEHDLLLSDMDAFICHPGGAKLLDALEPAFGLRGGELTDSRGVLRDYGNMSSATVMFVLERALHEGALHGNAWTRALVNSLGPGVTVGFVVLKR